MGLGAERGKLGLERPGKKGLVLRHLKIHSGEKSKKCSQCDYASSRAGHLRTHLKTHGGEKPNMHNGENTLEIATSNAMKMTFEMIVIIQISNIVIIIVIMIIMITMIIMINHKSLSASSSLIENLSPRYILLASAPHQSSLQNAVH